MMQGNPIRILIAEDHLIARIGLAAIINEQTDMTVVAQATNGQQAVELYLKHQPDVGVMDMFMPIMSGTDAIRAIRSQIPDARILALSTYSAEEEIRRAFAAGVQSYLTKDVMYGELVRAIRAVRQGRRYVSASIAHILSTKSPPPDLSSRELQVLNLIVEGQSNKEIAHALSITEDTVKYHVKNIMSKLHVSDRTRAATTAIQRGIIHFHL